MQQISVHNDILGFYRHRSYLQHTYPIFTTSAKIAHRRDKK